MRATLHSKFRGCLLGGLIGDCLGSAFEGEQTVGKSVLNTYMQRLLTTSGRVHQIFSYTDDTAMMFSVAESLLHSRGFDAGDLAKRFTDRYFKEPKRGYGGTAHVLHALRETEFADPLEPARVYHGGSGNWGNGSAMRIHPVSLFAHHFPDEQLIELCRNTSIVTHTHPLGVNGGILQALAVRQAINSSAPVDVGQFLDQLIEKMRVVEEATPMEEQKETVRSGDRVKKEKQHLHLQQSKTPYTDKLKEIKSVLLDTTQGSDLSVEEVAVKFGNSVAAIGSVPTAVYCALRSQKEINDYQTDNALLRTLYLSISIGGDTDTIASMACAITGALNGEEMIPTVIRSHCESFEEVINLADRLFQVVSVD